MGVCHDELGRRPVLPSDIDSLIHAHNLTIPEAEEAAYRIRDGGEDHKAAAADIKARRV